MKHEEKCLAAERAKTQGDGNARPRSENEGEQESITQMRRAWMEVLKLSLGKQRLMPMVVIGKVSLLSAAEFEKRIKVGIKWFEDGNAR